MTNPIYVESATSVFHNDHALRRLQRVNDTRFETEDGVVQVDEERWKVAKAYERHTWLVHNLKLETDRNEFHQEQFDGYAILPDNLGKVIELGCGVFTNLRLILPAHQATAVYLLDPLVKEYQAKHPNCTYKDGTLAGHDVMLINSAIEDSKTRLKFDTIVMINVIPHCRDALMVFEFIRKHLKIGGHLVMGEFPREHPARLHYDAGHPIALKAHVIDGFLAEFNEVYRNGYYFIGEAR